MGYVAISPGKLAEAWRYANSIHNAPKHRYANAYINWLCRGAQGIEPEHTNLTLMAAQAVRLNIATTKLGVDVL